MFGPLDQFCVAFQRATEEIERARRLAERRQRFVQEGGACAGEVGSHSEIDFQCNFED